MCLIGTESKLRRKICILELAKRRGLTINKKKTKIMVLSKKSDIPSSDIFLDGVKLEQTNQFDYLGSLVTSDCRCDKEIRRRIVLAKKAFIEKKSILADKKLNIKLRTRLLKCCLVSSALWLRKLDHKLKLQKEIGSCGNVVLPKNDANVVGEKNL